VWSPLYTLFYGSLQWLVHDAFAVTILHRVLLVMAASLLVLAVLRRLLSPGIAWALGVWWAILPVHYDTLYEDHVLAFVLGLAAVLIALSWSGLRMRAAVFGVLLADVVLMRYEVGVALFVWIVACVIYEVRQRRRREPTPLPRLAWAFGLPTLAVGLVMLYGTISYGGDLERDYQTKQSLAVCQTYALAYQQSHPSFTGSPWTDCEYLMRRDFGKGRPSLAEAIEANPGAMGRHFLRNARMSPSGLQALLFGQISAGPDRNPDYVPLKTHSSLALIGSFLLLAFVLGGLILLWRERERWWNDWVRERAWGWLALCCLTASAVAVMIVARPRPGFIFIAGVAMLAVVGMCAMAYAESWPALKRLRAAPVLIAVAVLILVPRHFDPEYTAPQIGRPGLPAKVTVDRLAPFRSDLQGTDEKLLATYAPLACPYVGRTDPCKPVPLADVFTNPAVGSVRRAIHERGIDFIYADRTDLEDPTTRAVIAALESHGWQRLAPSDRGADWVFLGRVASSRQPA
jgi:hypothetical protein